MTPDKMPDINCLKNKHRYNLCPVDFVATAAVRLGGLFFREAPNSSDGGVSPRRDHGSRGNDGPCDGAVAVVHLCAPTNTSLASLSACLRSEGLLVADEEPVAFRRRFAALDDVNHPGFLLKAILTGPPQPSAGQCGGGSGGHGYSDYADSLEAASRTPVSGNLQRLLLAHSQRGFQAPGNTPAHAATAGLWRWRTAGGNGSGGDTFDGDAELHLPESPAITSAGLARSIRFILAAIEAEKAPKGAPNTSPST